MINRPLTTSLAAVALAATAACTTTPTSAPGYYSTAPAPSSTYSRPVPYSDQGVVRAIEVIPVASRPVGAGAILGAIVGGVVGNQFGSGSGRALTTIGGAVAGGVAGNAIEDRASKRAGLEITIKLDNGQMIAVTQEADEAFHPGERVRILSGHGATRVTH
jgi:outer membrane lipoprotein SlyB